MAITTKRSNSRQRNGDAHGLHIGQVQSLTRGLTILERLTESQGISLTDLAHQVGLPNSTTHRLLTTMEQMGFVQQIGDRGAWSIGVRAFTVGRAFLNSREITTTAHAFLKKLMEQSGETANLSILDPQSGQVVLVGQVQCRELMRMLASIGDRLPIHASGAGKALLATMEESRVTQAIQAAGLPRLTSNTIDSITRLKEQVKVIQRQGYAFDDEEHASGLRSVAACVYDEYQQPFAAISVSGPTSRIPDHRVVELGSLVMRAARELTLAYGGSEGPTRANKASSDKIRK